MASAKSPVTSFLRNTPLVTSCIVVAAASGIYMVYLWALPKPIPGIPYDESARRNLLGSVPEIRAYVKEHGRLRPWLVGHSTRHGSALTQFWMGPLARPTLILADFQEARDILLRRGKEFDRSSRSISILSGPIGNHHIAMRSSDPRFKGNKELVRDLMTPTFLQEVTAPQVYRKAQHLIALWARKAEFAKGRPFDIKQDVVDAALDIINAAAFGFDDSMSTTKQQLDFLNSMDPAELDPVVLANGSADVPWQPHTPHIAAIHEFGRHVGTQFKAISPKLAHPYKVLTSPTLGKAIARKNEMICREIDKALERLRSGESDTRSAMDHVIQREMVAAKKAGRPPVFHSPQIYDEVRIVLISHHTSHMCICVLK